MKDVHVILFPTDFSAASDSALEVAASLAAESDATLWIVHVADDSTAALAGYAGFAFVPELPTEIASAAEALLQDVKPHNPNVTYRHRLLHGAPVDALLGFAEAEKVDLIVVGSHGRTGVARLLMGSVAEGIVRHAACPVLTVKHPLDDDDATTAESSAAETSPADLPKSPEQAPKPGPHKPTTKMSLH